MKLLILDENYPHLENIPGDTFVHVRAKEYAKLHEVHVFSFFKTHKELMYEGINVRFFSREVDLVEAIKLVNPDRILIHFFQPWMLSSLISRLDVPFIIWVHGYEALGWYRRIFNFNLLSPVFFRYVARNMAQQFTFRRLIRISNRNNSIRFVFVSDWMRRVTQSDTFTKIEHYDLVPNPIDTDLFNYVPKLPELRNRILLLRSFESKKYANDVAVAAILELSKCRSFKKLHFTIVGDGALFDSTVASVRGFGNVSVVKGFVENHEIPSLHLKNGLFLCPTRQDAQGVSMCEAMSSGLIPITSPNTAIPEFVEHGVSGKICANVFEIAAAILHFSDSESEFLTYSQNSAMAIRRLCDLEKVVAQERKIIESSTFG
jgi:L-malate glycosyltransferase